MIDVQTIAGMKSPRRPPVTKLPPVSIAPLYVGQWIAALGSTAREVSDGAEVNEGYLSQLISGEKDNPGWIQLSKIANFLGIPVWYFGKPPPAESAVNQARDIDASTLARLYKKEK